MEDGKIQELKDRLSETEVYAAFVYGSYARGESFNDIDVAVFTEEGIETVMDLSGSLPEVFDIHDFHELPMHVRHRVLEEGELIYCSDENRLYDETIRFVKEFEQFKPLYQEYLEGVRNRG